MGSQQPPTKSVHIGVFQLANELSVKPELIWGVAQRLQVGRHLDKQGGFVLTTEEAERISSTVRMLLQQRAEEGQS